MDKKDNKKFTREEKLQFAKEKQQEKIIELVKEGWIVQKVGYAEYKNRFAIFDTVLGSYDNEAKTIDIIIKKDKYDACMKLSDVQIKEKSIAYIKQGLKEEVKELSYKDYKFNYSGKDWMTVPYSYNAEQKTIMVYPAHVFQVAKSTYNK